VVNYVPECQAIKALKILHNGILYPGISGKLSSGILGKVTPGTLVNFAAEWW